MNAAPSSLLCHAIASDLVALAPRRAVCRAVSREPHGLLASGMGAALATCAVGDAHASEHHAIVATGMEAFLSHMLGHLPPLSEFDNDGGGG